MSLMPTSDDMTGAAPVPEVRIDQLTGLRTVLAPGRANRPDAFHIPAVVSKPDAVATCPFCEGRESSTPPEVWALRDDPSAAADTPGWRTRVVPNKFAALVAAADAPPAPPLATGRDQADMFVPKPAIGVHEVIINSPRHVTSLTELDGGEFETAVSTWASRVDAHEQAGAAYVHLILNEGPLAGASLEHSHAQVYALDFVPAMVARERERSASYHQRTQGGVLLGDILAEEVRRRERLVAIDDNVALVCPWASRSPFEMRLIPRTGGASFAESGAAVAPMLRTALDALAAALGSLPQLNLWVRSAPRDARENDVGFTWHLDIRPRLGTQAGLELGAGVDLCSYAPEQAAADLRAAIG